MTQAKPTGWVFIYIILGIIWGSSFLFTHVALEMLPPVGVVFWRLLLGALALAAVIAIRRGMIFNMVTRYLARLVGHKGRNFALASFRHTGPRVKETRPVLNYR